MNGNFLYWFLALAAIGIAAQQAEPPSTNAPASSDIIVLSEDAVMEMRIGLITYRGNVRVDDPGKMQMTCEYMVVHRPSTNIESIIAHTNVVIDLIDANGEKTKARGAQAVYTSSNNIVELTGSPSMENSQGSMTADLILLNRADNNLHGRGNVKTRLKSAFLNTTNPPSTNPPPARPSTAVTNRPPPVKAANGP